MKTLSKLLISFVLLGSLVSCGSDGGSSGSSSNAGSTDSGSVISNQCTSNLKNYLNDENYSLTKSGIKYVDLTVVVDEVRKAKDWYGREYLEFVDDLGDGNPRVYAGKNMAFLQQLANSATACSQQYDGFIIDVGSSRYFISHFNFHEANPVQTLVPMSNGNYEFKAVKKYLPDGVNYKEYDLGYLFDKWFK